MILYGPAGSHSDACYFQEGLLFHIMYFCSVKDTIAERLN